MRISWAKLATVQIKCIFKSDNTIHFCGCCWYLARDAMKKSNVDLDLWQSKGTADKTEVRHVFLRAIIVVQKRQNNGFLFGWIESSPFFDVRYFICRSKIYRQVVRTVSWNFRSTETTTTKNWCFCDCNPHFLSYAKIINAQKLCTLTTYMANSCSS